MAGAENETEHERAPARRWPRRLVIGICGTLVISLIAAGSTYAYLRYRFEQVHHVHVQGVKAQDPGGPMNVLLVGSDTRSALQPGQAAQFGSGADVSGQRSDTIMILHVDPKQTKASLLSIPRDLWVPIAGTPSSNRINSAFDAGPDRLVATIETDLGIKINHYVEVNFDGFRSIVNTVGGVDVYFAAPARDAVTGLNIPNAGCVHLTGNDALSYVRSRDYQYFESGSWRPDPTSDIGRIQRQQDFIRRVLRKVAAVRNPLKLNQLITSGVKNVTVDSGLGAGQMLGLARRFHSLSPDAVNTFTLPTKPSVIGGADVLVAVEPGATQTVQAFLSSAAPTPPAAPPAVLPSSVRVRVLNGSGTNGEAGVVGDALRRLAFNVAATGDADNFSYVATTIRYGSGQQAKAQLLQTLVIGQTQLVSDPTLRTVDLVLTTGSAYGGIRPAELPGAPATTTTGPAEAKPASRGAAPQPQC